MKHRLFFVVLWSFLCLVSSLAIAQQPPVLLIVDVTEPNAVTFTATGAAPSVSVPSGYVFFDGFDLQNFFTAGTSYGSSGNLSTLTTGDASTGPLLNYVASDFLTTNDPTTRLDLNIYGGIAAPFTFTIGSPAFIGTLTLGDLAGLPLQSPGFVGTLVAGFSGNTNTVAIGSFLVVPEPSTIALCSVGLVAVAVSRRRRK